MSSLCGKTTLGVLLCQYSEKVAGAGGTPVWLNGAGQTSARLGKGGAPETLAAADLAAPLDLAAKQSAGRGTEDGPRRALGLGIDRTSQ